MVRAAHVELDGVLVIDKPAGHTSAAVVAEVRRRLRTDRAGHTGTLDPLATGVLPICLGDATKLTPWLVADDKAYEAELELGAVTDTLDATGEVVAEDRAGAAAVTEAELRAALARFVGAQEQVPPMYSAIKQGGQRLYNLARAGEAVDRAPRPIVVHRFELLAFAPPRATVVIECSKGTYVRSLVDDVGKAVGCGAHLTGLRRTLAGRFTAAQALHLMTLTRAGATAALIPAAQLLAMRSVPVPDDLLPAISNAQGPRLAAALRNQPKDETFQLVSAAGALLALVRLEDAGLKFERVFKERCLAGARGA